MGAAGHSVNVANYARKIGIIIGLGKPDLDQIYLAGLMHDFGYFLLDDAILNKIKNDPDLTIARSH